MKPRRGRLFAFFIDLGGVCCAIPLPTSQQALSARSWSDIAVSQFPCTSILPTIQGLTLATLDCIELCMRSLERCYEVAEETVYIRLAPLQLSPTDQLYLG